MTSREEIAPVFELALKLLDEREPVYGDSWKESGFETCFEQIPRKANYLAVQKRNGFATSDKFGEDLLDQMNWCAMTYILRKGGQQDG